MKIEDLRYGMAVRHPDYGDGVVQGISEHTIDVRFDDGKRTISPISSGLEPTEPMAALSGLELPLQQLIEEVVSEAIKQTGIEKPDLNVNELADRWKGGVMELKPFDRSLQSKELPLEVFFNKIVLMRNNLRVLEQKINTSKRLESSEKFDWQQYLSKCYGSMTTFNVLFKTKESQFSSK